jgi:hypothetical protein
VKAGEREIVWKKEGEGVCVQGGALFSLVSCVDYYSTYYKAVRVGGGGDSGGHVLRETTSRGLCGIVCPTRTSERGD